MFFIGTMTISTFIYMFQPLVTKTEFFTNLDENWPVDAHYRTDEGYYVNNEFLPPGGTATCCFWSPKVETYI